MCNSWQDCPNFSTCEQLQLNLYNQELRNSNTAELRSNSPGAVVLSFQSISQFVDYHSQKIEADLELYQNPVPQNSVNVCHFNSFTEEDLGSDVTVFVTNSVNFAEILVWSIRGTWDGCNAVSIKEPDSTAIEAVADLFEIEFGIKAEFCQSGDFCCIPRSKYPKKILEAITGETWSEKSIFVNFFCRFN